MKRRLCLKIEMRYTQWQILMHASPGREQVFTISTKSTCRSCKSVNPGWKGRINFDCYWKTRRVSFIETECLDCNMPSTDPCKSSWWILTCRECDSLLTRGIELNIFFPTIRGCVLDKWFRCNMVNVVYLSIGKSICISHDLLSSFKSNLFRHFLKSLKIKKKMQNRIKYQHGLRKKYIWDLWSL